jgi:hypothetical protein
MQMKVQPPSTTELNFGVPTTCQVRSIIVFQKKKKNIKSRAILKKLKIVAHSKIEWPTFQFEICQFQNIILHVQDLELYLEGALNP